jgi:hypothetical protein
MLLVAVGFGTAPSPGPLLAETLKTVSWSLLACVGVALGRVAAKGQVPLEGVTGLLAAPLALTAANTVQRASRSWPPCESRPARLGIGSC